MAAISSEEAMLSDASLTRLADELGSESRSLGIFLGLPKVKVDLCFANHPHDMEAAIIDIMTKWRNKTRDKGAEAQVAQLVQALREISRVDLAERVMDGDFLGTVRGGTGAPIQETMNMDFEEEDSVPYPVQAEADAAPPQGSVNTPYQGIHVQETTTAPARAPPPTYPLGRMVGRALIINNIKFPTRHQENRRGMEKDSCDLERVLKKLGFKVTTKLNLNSTEMKKAIRKFVETKDHSYSTCLLVSVMTHGSGPDAMGTDWQGVRLHQDIFTPIIRSSIDCPKIFIMQMCRGGELDFGRWRTDASRPGDGPEDEYSDSSVSDSEEMVDDEDLQVDWVEVEQSLQPTDSDSIILFACAEGRKALRHSLEGSVLIQNVVKVFDAHGQEEDIDTLFTRVRHEVANCNAYIDVDGSQCIVKQAAETRVFLRKKLFLQCQR
ncbi:caspase-7-like isoform X1 [Branchiostoma floridae]|uniref:Caspase-7-like isoform X1 n=1 Tax=Branchiostoma floridae TaxID=7739 RepID=A0A9J7ME00_BRAFL|nr:caspase-7-like isoform X1 [Branchiostoma floridae]XP_035699173.1 caspase-7-like isoform X1 [Branchiostoma floridae]XP_035699174.1 caspase-7-like isoform X1 [Branchiostoma floridae]